MSHNKAWGAKPKRCMILQCTSWHVWCFCVWFILCWVCFAMFTLMSVAVLPLYLCGECIDSFAPRAEPEESTTIVTFCSLWPLPCVKYLTYLTCFHCVSICPSLTPPGFVRKEPVQIHCGVSVGGAFVVFLVYIVCRPPRYVAAVHPEKLSGGSHYQERGHRGLVWGKCVCEFVWCLTECFFPTRFFLCDRYRFAEIRYHRPEETHKGRTVPAHVETVVLFLPDVWHCLPTRSEWEGQSRGLKEQLAEKLLAERKEADGEQALNANPSLLISASHRHRNRQTKHSERHRKNQTSITGIIPNPLVPIPFLIPVSSPILHPISSCSPSVTQSHTQLEELRSYFYDTCFNWLNSFQLQPPLTCQSNGWIKFLLNSPSDFKILNSIRAWNQWDWQNQCWNLEGQLWVVFVMFVCVFLECFTC